ncbi:AP-1 complex subunit mu-1 isoform X3 [Hippopotamus amphibius kiboko]|uniref:AP-1 complex subunit mu-1 isoform X3 n=1 Tax=Hippopotamus amphibius kiboko TaxID=575201 RepID=UPI002592091A|nr:AP-1 complex subunit mu-1 isoform X3 [Hippopotamus amphibius kiboko]
MWPHAEWPCGVVVRDAGPAPLPALSALGKWHPLCACMSSSLKWARGEVFQEPGSLRTVSKFGHCPAVIFSCTLRSLPVCTGVKGHPSHSPTLSRRKCSVSVCSIVLLFGISGYQTSRQPWEQGPGCSIFTSPRGFAQAPHGETDISRKVSANGNVLRSEIVGSIKMRVFLSGMPELRLGLNDKVLFDNTGRGKSKSVELEDVKFHQCVRLSRFENDRTISFIPPDGEFELMSYRLNTHVKPLIWIESVIEKHSHSRIEYMIKAKSQFKRRSTANNVEIHIPVPNDADSPKFKTTVGSVKWVPENSEIVWSIKSFPGGKEYLMRAHFGLPSVEAEDKEGKPPISVKFEIPYFTTSGIQVRYLKIIEKSGYQALPWVRYITQNGDYQLRTQ